MASELQNRTVVRVPDVVGLPLEKASILFETAGLPRVVVLYRESYEERDTVLEQRPSRGQMVYEDTEVTLHIARRGYLEHLPAIYRRSDAVGGNLVRELCFIFEHLFGSVGDKLDLGFRYYDPHMCPPEFLAWLASWTGFVIDADWPIEKKRALIKRSVDLYRIRGTTRGLCLFLKLFTGHEPEIHANEWPFKGFRVDTDARIGLDSVVLPPVDLAHSFVVAMPIRFDQLTTVQAHQLLQGLPDHRAGLERRRALPRRKAQAAQPHAFHAPGIVPATPTSCGCRAAARRPLHRGRRRLRHRRAGQRHPAAREADQDHQPRRLQAAADHLHRAALRRGLRPTSSPTRRTWISRGTGASKRLQGRVQHRGARHRTRGRARASLPGEGREARVRRPRSERPGGQRDRPALRPACRRARPSMPAAAWPAATTWSRPPAARSC
jgi:phage tail-like protein